ncbi:hypothetical protein D3C81_2194920 [compost metagenome]
MALWIKFLQAGAQHPHGLPADVQCSLMSGAIDPQRQAAGNHKSALGKVAGKGRSGVERRA